MTNPEITLFTVLYLWYKMEIGKTNNVAAKKFAATPTGSPLPIIKYRTFLIAITITPAIGEKISPAIIAGISPKSTFKYGGINGSGKFKKNSKKEIAPSNDKIINFNKLDDCCMNNLSPHLFYRFTTRDEGSTIISCNIKTLKPNLTGL